MDSHPVALDARHTIHGHDDVMLEGSACAVCTAEVGWTLGCDPITINTPLCGEVPGNKCTHERPSKFRCRTAVKLNSSCLQFVSYSLPHENIIKRNWPECNFQQIPQVS